jgi:hypothetical protein
MRYDKFRAHGRFTEKIETPALNGATARAASLIPGVGAMQAKAPAPHPSMLPYAPANPAPPRPTVQF